jgi:arylsulfatase A-like enzyme
MAPLADVCLFALPGLIFGLVAWWRPGLNLKPKAGFVFAFLAFLSPLLMFASLHRYAALILAAGLAVQVARLIKAYAAGFDGIVRHTTPWLVALVIGLAGCLYGWQWMGEQRARASLPNVSRDAPNVLLIVLDTVRAQNLSLYGYERRTTPNLERLARGGVVFERALSTSPWTLPSHGSMFTGRNPHELSADWWKPLDNKYPTLAEVLGAQGYLTGGFVANLWYCTYELGLQRGFLHYEDFVPSARETIRSSSLAKKIAGHKVFRHLTGHFDELGRKDAVKINNDFLSWVSRTNRRPFFAFLNYYDAHAPYLPPEPFLTRFGPEFPGRNPSIIADWRSSRINLSAAETRAELNAYDGSIAYLDHHLGVLFDELNRRGVLKNTLVIVTSDHGEHFGEQGLFDHGNSLYRQLLQVPLVIRLPSKVPANKRIHDVISLREIPSTILDILRLEGDLQFPGESLARYWENTPYSVNSAEPVLSEVTRDVDTPRRLPNSKGGMKSLVIDGMHYIKNGNGSEELYDFENDPLEVRDLSSSKVAQPAIERFQRALATILATDKLKVERPRADSWPRMANSIPIRKPSPIFVGEANRGDQRAR